MIRLAEARILLVGAGGLGSPAALALARSGARRMTVIDDDTVDLSNLHRQLLFTDADVGADKSLRAAERLRNEGVEVEALRGRLVPDGARELISQHDLVVEGADNFATKFLTCDAAQLARVPVVQAGAVRWNGWALATLPGRSACLRCVFEDIPRDREETCAEAGVIGPVVGVLGAVQAALAVRLLTGDASAAGEVWNYRGLEGRLRVSRVHPRPDCAACTGQIRELTIERYTSPSCVPTHS